MKVTVIHTAFEDTPKVVATVEAPHAVVEEALEFAYRWTQNIMDSWSKKMPADGNPAVTVEADLHVDANGDVWGLRSTAMRDQMIVDGRRFEVDMIGFKEVDTRQNDAILVV